MVDYVDFIARQPAAKQEEALSKLEALVHGLCELDDEGKLDINFTRHPVIEIEKDGDPASLEN